MTPGTCNFNNAHTDSVTLTNGSNSFTDASATSADVGVEITSAATGFPAPATVVSVVRVARHHLGALHRDHRGRLGDLRLRAAGRQRDHQPQRRRDRRAVRAVPSGSSYGSSAAPAPRTPPSTRTPGLAGFRGGCRDHAARASRCRRSTPTRAPRLTGMPTATATSRARVTRRWLSTDTRHTAREGHGSPCPSRRVRRRSRLGRRSTMNLR